MGSSLTPVALSALCLALAAPIHGVGSDVSKELAELYRADQEDQNNFDSMPLEEALDRQKKRRDRVAEIVQAGELEKPIDYHHASWIFQHGENADDFLMAHLLATAASFGGEDQARFLSAAGLDRFLMNLGHPQRFGSQFTDAAGTDMGDAALLSHRIVRVFLEGDGYVTTGLNGRPVDESQRTKKILKKVGKDLKKLAKSAPKLAKKEAAGEERAEALKRTGEIVRAGQLEEPADFFHAAEVFHHLGESVDHRVQALALTTAAVLLEHKDARKRYPEALDRLLDSLERPRLFGELEAGGPPRPELLELHRNVRAQFEGKGRKR